MKRVVIAAMALAAATTATPAAAQGACNRELLQGIANSWVNALQEGSPFKMNLGEWVDFRQNLEPGFMSEFFDMNARKLDWHLALLDTGACKVAVESISAQPTPQVVAAQMANGFFGVGPFDVIVPDQAPDPAATREKYAAENWAPLPEGSRASRAELMAAADAWLADKQFPEAKDRAYVVDETLGAVNVMAKAGGERATSYTLRIEGGQVRQVHTLAK